MISLEDFWGELLQSNLHNNKYWKKKLFDTNSKIHLALMVEPYLSLILNGKKTIESRFSKNKIIPFNKISSGDIVIIKKSGGNLVAIFEVETVIFKKIESDNDFEKIKENYGKELCLDNDFWESKRSAKYVTLIRISHLQAITPIVIKKANRQSWLTYTRDHKEISVNNKENHVVCIVGEIASGKTTVAKELASVMQGTQFSISDFLKECLKKEGIEKPTRTQLQELGECYIAKGWEEFCDDFLDFINYDKNKIYVIDGIRHKEFFYALCNKLYPITPILVYLDTDSEILIQRELIRKEKEYNNKRLAEGNLKELYNLADIIIDTSSKDVNYVIDNILQITNGYIKKKIDDSKVVLQDIKEMIDNFNKKRNWNSYHNAMNLAMSINIEAAELLEIFQWSDKKDADRKARFSYNEHLREELADILIYCINLANAYEIDISSCIIEKLQKNAKKYPST